jgi:hypothetical protein
LDYSLRIFKKQHGVSAIGKQCLKEIKNFDEVFFIASRNDVNEVIMVSAIDNSMAGWISQFDEVIIDDADLTENDNILRSITHNTDVIGFAHTCERRGWNKEYIGMFYRQIIQQPSCDYLIGINYMVPHRVTVKNTPDMSECRYDYEIGDYKRDSIENAYIGRRSIMDALSAYNGSKTLYVAESKDQAVIMCATFNDAGINATYIRGSTDYFDKNADVICCHRIPRGVFYDINIECVMLHFSTYSRSRYMRAISIGAQAYPGKSCFELIDFGGNYDRFGDYWSFQNEGLWNSQSRFGGVLETEECFNCGIKIPKIMRVCPFCKKDRAFGMTDFEMDLELLKEDDKSLPPDRWVHAMMHMKTDVKYIISEYIKGYTEYAQKERFLHVIGVLKKDYNLHISPNYYSFVKKFLL